MDNFVSFNEARQVKHYTFARSFPIRPLFAGDHGWWRKSQQSWCFNPKGRVEKEREKKGEREAEGKNGDVARGNSRSLT